jgi:hypothetical protein
MLVHVCKNIQTATMFEAIRRPFLYRLYERKGGIGGAVVENVVLETAIKAISPILYPNRAVLRTTA